MEPKMPRILMDDDSGVSINWVNHALMAMEVESYLKNSRMDFMAVTNEEPNPVDIRTYRGISQNNAPQHGGGIYALNTHILIYWEKPLSRRSKQCI